MYTGTAVRGAFRIQAPRAIYQLSTFVRFGDHLRYMCLVRIITVPQGSWELIYGSTLQFCNALTAAHHNNFFPWNFEIIEEKSARRIMLHLGFNEWNRCVQWKSETKNCPKKVIPPSLWLTQFLFVFLTVNMEKQVLEICFFLNMTKS